MKLITVIMVESNLFWWEKGWLIVTISAHFAFDTGFLMIYKEEKNLLGSPVQLYI